MRSGLFYRAARKGGWRGKTTAPGKTAGAAKRRRGKTTARQNDGAAKRLARQNDGAGQNGWRGKMTAPGGL
jgi:hypothetical protein